MRTTFNSGQRFGTACGNAIKWAVRHRWRCWAWYTGPLAFASACWWAYIELASPHPEWQPLPAALMFSWPAGAAVGGLIDAFVRSRRSKSDTPAITGR